MKQISTLYLTLLLLLVGSTSVLGQTTITIGTGATVNTTTTASPINIWYRSLRYQVVYTAAELNAAGANPGVISEIGFNVTGVPLYSLPNYTISMKNTPALNAGAHDGVGLTQVYNNTLYTPTAGGWDMLVLNTPFFWDGQSSLLVDICFDQTNPTYNQSGQVLVFSSASGARYSRSDVTPQCGLTTGTTLQEKAQVRFVMSPPPAFDVGIESIPPIGGGCGLTFEPVSVNIENIGSDTVVNVTASLSVDGNFVVLDTITTPILPGTIYTHTFSVLGNFSAFGTHTASVSVNVTNDAFSSNNSGSTSLFNETVYSSFPYLETFDGLTNCLAGCSNTTCATSVDPINWKNLSTDDMNWSVNANGTSSANTGPPADHTTGTSTGKYLYTESSGCNNIDAVLESPCFDLGSLVGAPDVRVEFWYHMYGQTMGTLTLEMDTASTGVFIPVWTLSGNQGNQWSKASVSIGAYAGNVVRFRISAVTGTSFYSDIAIDDFAVFPVFSDDLRVKKILTPNPLDCSYSNAESISIELENLGANAATNVEVSLWSDGNFVVKDTITTTIQPLAVYTHTFSQPADMSALILHTIQVACAAPNESYPTNDTLSDAFGQSLVTNYPYTVNFDNWGSCLATCTDGSCASQPTTLAWKNLTGGTDNGDWSIHSGSTSSTLTGPTGDHTSGSGKYLYTESSGCNSKTITVESPCFALTGMVAPQVSFWYHMYGQTMGSLTLQVDAGNGFTNIWTLSGDQGDQWNEAVVPVGAYIGQVVRFRIVGFTGTSFYSDMAIDDFRVGDAPCCDAGITALVGPGIGGCNVLSNAETVTVALTNYGAQNLTNAQVKLFVNSVLVANETFVGSVPPNTTINYSFTTPINLTQPGSIVISASAQSLPQDDKPWNNEKTFFGFNDGASLVTNYPYSESFDNFTNCISSCADGSCAGIGGTSGWRNDAGDDADWSVMSGATLTTNTGPDQDHTSGNGNYCYTEATCSNSDFYLTSPCLDFTNLSAPEVSFWYHMFGTSTGTLRVEVDSTGAGNWIQVWSLTGNQSNQWNEAAISLQNYAGKVVRVRFFATTGPGILSDIAIDDFLVREVLAHDLQVIDVQGPNDGCGDEQSSINVKLFNYGYSTETDYTVTVVQTGLTNQSLTQNVTTPLATEDSIIVTVGPFNTALGGLNNYTATVVINNATDQDPSNDADNYSWTSYALSYPVGIDNSRCGIGSLTVSTGGTATEFFWYTDSIGGNYVDTGFYYTTPFLTETTTYWIEGRNPFTGFVGPADRNVEEGGYYDFYSDGVVFDALFDMTLNRVRVYPLYPGIIKVNLEDAQGNLLDQKSFNFGGTVTDTTLTLNFDVPKGTGYKLHAAGSTTEMYRNRDNDLNFNITYPYLLDGATRITGPINGLPGAYYFFYNWRVTYLGCPSPRVPVQAIIAPTGFSATTSSANESAPNMNNGTATISVTGGTGTYTYLWDDPAGQTTATATGLAGDSTTYHVTVTDAAGCAEIFSVVVMTSPVSTSEIEGLRTLEIFPNPSQGQFNINLDMDGLHNVQIEIINVLGQVIFTTSPENVSARKYPIQLSNLPSGIYKVRIRIDDQYVTRSIMLNSAD